MDLYGFTLTIFCMIGDTLPQVMAGQPVRERPRQRCVSANCYLIIIARPPDLISYSFQAHVLVLPVRRPDSPKTVIAPAGDYVEM